MFEYNVCSRLKWMEGLIYRLIYCCCLHGRAATKVENKVKSSEQTFAQPLFLMFHLIHSTLKMWVKLSDGCFSLRQCGLLIQTGIRPSCFLEKNFKVLNARR